MKARISDDCVKYIYGAFNHDHGAWEIGGIILGFRHDNEITAIKAVSVPSTNDCSYSYSLDGDKATDIVNSSEYDFVGIWHSHINSCDHFSETDKKINQEFAEMFGYIISILIVSDNEDSIRIFAFLVNKDGENMWCLWKPSSIEK